MKDRVSSQPTVTLLKHIPGYRSPVPSRHKTENVVYAEVHQQPRVCVAVFQIYSLIYCSCVGLLWSFDVYQIRSNMVNYPSQTVPVQALKAFSSTKCPFNHHALIDKWLRMAVEIFSWPTSTKDHSGASDLASNPLIALGGQTMISCKKCICESCFKHFAH